MPKNKDGYFRATFTAGQTPEGKPRRVVVRGKTKREMEERLAEAKRQYAVGLSGEHMTVAEWAERWLRVYKANATIGQQSHYRTRLNKDILPAIGHYSIRSVRASDLQAILNSYSGGKFGTVEKIKQTIKQLFEYAEVEGIIERDPARRIELPYVTEAKRRPLTDVERHAVLHVAKTHKAGAYILTMLYCGLRRGEAVALTVGDINLQEKIIDVTKSLDMKNNKGRVKGPKSAAGVRIVPIPDLLVPYLAPLCSNREGSAPLFAKVDGAAATHQTCIWWWNSFKRACHIESGAKLYRNAVLTETSPFGDEVTPHFLRHTYATDLYAAGVDEKAQKTFLGHASQDVTDIYRKMNSKAFERAARQLNEYYERTVPNMCQ